MLSDDLNSYFWDAFGALAGISPKDGSDATRFAHGWDIFGGARLGNIGRGFNYVNFGYDGFGRLSDMYWNVTPRFRTELHFYDGDDMVLDHRGIGTGTEQFRRYVHGQGTDQPLAMEIYAPNAPPTPGTGTVYYFHPDGEDSIRLLTDAAGQVANRYDYDSFGRRIAVVEAAEQPYGWKARENVPGWDMVYNRARFYSPQLGRFIEEDPIAYGGGDSNLYAFAGNNVRKWNDPSGTTAVENAAFNNVLKTAAVAAVGCAVSRTLSELALWIGEYSDVRGNWCLATGKPPKEKTQPGSGGAGGDDPSDGGGGGDEPGEKKCTGFQCVPYCAEQSIGIGTAVGATGVGLGYPTVGKPFTTPGASTKTSLASTYLRKWLPGRLPFGVWAPTWVNPLSATKSIGAIVGRWVPWISGASLYFTFDSAFVCTLNSGR